MTDAAGFRAGLAESRLLVRRCLGCRRAAYPPMPGCPHCGHEDGEVVEASGQGTLYSWTVSHVAFAPALAEEVPYVVGLVDLDEGARVVARIELAAERLEAGMTLQAAFPDEGGDAGSLRFVAATDGGGGGHE